MAGELQTAKASLTAHKGHFTRQRKSLEARQKAFIVGMAMRQFLVMRYHSAS